MLFPSFACSIDAYDGTPTAGHTGIGAGVDSFLEYLLKVRRLGPLAGVRAKFYSPCSRYRQSGILLDDDALVRAHAEAAAAIAEHMLLWDSSEVPPALGVVHMEVSYTEVSCAHCCASVTCLL